MLTNRRENVYCASKKQNLVFQGVTGVRKRKQQVTLKAVCEIQTPSSSSGKPRCQRLLIREVT